MAITTFDGPIRSLGGIYQQGPSTIVEITASTTLDPVAHGGRIISVGGTLASNVVLTLPTINTSANSPSSGPGNDPNTSNKNDTVIRARYQSSAPTPGAGDAVEFQADADGNLKVTVAGGVIVS